MEKLDGFQLTLFCSANDFHRTNYISQAEFKALLQPFSLNDSAPPKCYKVNRSSLSIFIPLNQATEPKVWESIIGWIRGRSGRTLRLRYRNMGGDIVTLEDIQPLLEKTLKELTSLARNVTEPNEN